MNSYDSRTDIAFWIMVILAFGYGIGSGIVEFHSETPEKIVNCEPQASP